MTMRRQLTAPAATPFEFGTALANRPTSYGEMLGAEIGEGLGERPLVGNAPPELITQPEEWDWLLEQRLDYIRETFGREPTEDEIDFQRAQIERGRNNQAQQWTPLEQQTWQASEWFREGIPYEEGMTEERAQWLAQRYDDTQFNQWVVANHEGVGFGISTVSGFLARLVGNIPDPTNFIPFVGPTMRVAMVGRLGAIGGRAAAGSLDAMIGASLAEPLVIQGRQRIGEEMTFAEALLDVAMSGLIGASFGGAGGALARRGEARAAARAETANAMLTDLRVADEALTKTTIAIRQIEEGRPVDVPRVSSHSVEEALVGLNLQERSRLAQAAEAHTLRALDDRYLGRTYDGDGTIRFAEPTAEEIAAVRGDTARQVAIGRAAVDAENERLDLAQRELPPRQESEAFATREEPLTPVEAPRLTRPDEGRLVAPRETRRTVAPFTRLERMALYDPNPVLRQAARAELDRRRETPTRTKAAPRPESVEAVRPEAESPRVADRASDIDPVAEAQRLQKAYGEQGISDDGSFPERAQYDALDEAGELLDSERAAVEAANENVAKTNRADEFYDAAAVCLLR